MVRKKKDEAIPVKKLTAAQKLDLAQRRLEEEEAAQELLENPPDPDWLIPASGFQTPEELAAYLELNQIQHNEESVCNLFYDIAEGKAKFTYHEDKARIVKDTQELRLKLCVYPEGAMLIR
jgi:hypothetical protein